MLGTRSVAAAAACSPTALVRGPDDVVAAIEHTLAGRGITTELVDGCPFVRATISVRTVGLSVAIEDPDGRAHDHVVTDADVAATLIESWVRPDVEAPLLAARGWPGAGPRRSAAVDPETPPALVLRHDPVRTLGSAVALETSLGSDGSIWWGGSAATCVRLGAICAGADVRLASDSRSSGDSEVHDTARTALDVLLVADVPLRTDAFQVTLGGGAGVGWVRSHAPHAPGVVDVDAGGLRVDAHVIVEIPVARAFAVELRAALSLSPLAHVGTYLDEGLTLAGDPRGFARVSVGLRYGAR